MAAASPAPSTHSMSQNTLNKSLTASKDYKRNSDLYKQLPTLSSNSRSTNRGDGVSNSISNSNEISTQKFHAVNKQNEPDGIDGRNLAGYVVKNVNENHLSNITTLNGISDCNSSLSDAVAKCFECASYMPTQQRPLLCSTYSVNNATSQPAGLVLSHDTGLETINGGKILNGDSSRFGASATMELGDIVGRCNNQHLLNNSGGVGGIFDNLCSDRLHSTSLNSNTTLPYDGDIGVSPYSIWSSSGVHPFPNSMYLLNTLVANANRNCESTGLSGAVNTVSDSLSELRSKLFAEAVNAKKSPIKRLIMVYHCKFGEFGVAEGQFTEPSGVAVNAQNYIIVADTNNHRIQVFDRDGRFKFQFGECGKRDSQLLYPNRVAISSTTGDIVVTERSPTHQVQIYNQYGQFVRKFGANILQHPRGLTVDSRGRIIVVECKVMRVVIFDHNGNVLHKFGCSKHLRFPNGVVVNDKEEIFISDNRAHCVKVFNYEGHYLRQIGGEGLTNYPIGVCINAKGEILIADNHNNFNLTIFTQDGQLVSAHESRVKHAQCFDVALIDDANVVLASKDYRLYIYRYTSVLPMDL